MSIIISVFAFIVIFSILVLVHECGHFFVARWFGIKVEEFGFGMPPRIFGKKIGETIYSINWIPFGGFVKLLGEDASDPKMLSNKRSFASKSARARILVVIAGVLMNFFLAYILLTVGFIFGIQPLILDVDEVFDNLKNGTIHVDEGVIVKSVKDGGPAEIVGLKAGDRILDINGREVFGVDSVNFSFEDEQNVNLNVQRDGEMHSFNVVLSDDKDIGFEVFDTLALPRVVVFDVKPDSSADIAGIMKGDVILKINEEDIYLISEYEKVLDSFRDLKFEILRDNEVLTFDVSSNSGSSLIISTVFSDSPAYYAGFEVGDLILSISGEKVVTTNDLMEIYSKNLGKTLNYVVFRDGVEVDISVDPDQDGLIGVGLAVLKPFDSGQLSVYIQDFAVSVLKIDNVSYPFYVAPVVAFNESVKLSFLTVDMAVNVFKSVFTKLNVPQGVAGPVGIAQLTHNLVQEGFLSLIRFVALLSLSLAIINILPFPALDGGRLLFILVEVVIGKKLNAKFEGLVHAIGFMLLMLLIVAVTYNDIMRLF